MKQFRTGIILFIVVDLLALGTVNGAPQVRLEASHNCPLKNGLSNASILGTGGSIDFSQYHLIVPDFRAYYQFGDDFIRGGIGVRVPTFIIVSLFWPEAFVELNLHPVVLEASLGGFLFGGFGLGVGSFTVQPWVIPDLNASIEIAPWFRLGGGVLFLAPFNSWNQDFLYIAYVGARFIFLVK